MVLLFVQHRNEAVEHLLQIYPDAIRQKDEDGCACHLHFACYQQASKEVLTLLLEKHPLASREMDENGWTPLHLMLVRMMHRCGVDTNVC